MNVHLKTKHEDLVQAATLTWICAANVDKAVKQWTADLRKAPKDASVEELQVCCRAFIALMMAFSILFVE